MSKKDKASRIYSRKAVTLIEEIIDKYPSGISDVMTITEEARAWLQIKIQQLRECLKRVWFVYSKKIWWEPLRLTRNKAAHQTEDLSDEAFS